MLCRFSRMTSLCYRFVPLNFLTIRSWCKIIQYFRLIGRDGAQEIGCRLTKTTNQVEKMPFLSVNVQKVEGSGNILSSLWLKKNNERRKGWNRFSPHKYDRFGHFKKMVNSIVLQSWPFALDTGWWENVAVMLPNISTSLFASHIYPWKRVRKIGLMIFFSRTCSSNILTFLRFIKVSSRRQYCLIGNVILCIFHRSSRVSSQPISKKI